MRTRSITDAAPEYAVIDRYGACIVADFYSIHYGSETVIHTFCGETAVDPDTASPSCPEDICGVCLGEAKDEWPEAEWPSEWKEEGDE